ncbi:MAG TPA: hypothetical protein VFE14_14020 [Micromonosporaceae bacterium]|jgi:hypothetical protein|nr:hypothetical protein [Micromonosporaceae bacterium]
MTPPDTSTTPHAVRAGEVRIPRQRTPGEPETTPAPRRPGALLRAHWAIVVLLGAAAVLRALVMIAYRPAFWYPDSSGYVGLSGNPLHIHNSRPNGYAGFLMVLRPTHSYLAVVAVQHLLGLLMGLAVYVFLVHRRLPRWLACVAAATVLFDSLELTLEHYVLTETMFTTLLVAGVLVVLWSDRPGLWACTCAGLLLALTWITRPSTLPVGLLLGGYLLLRRVGWRPLTGYAVAFALPLVAVLAVIGGRPSPYGSSWTARTIYSRVAGFADCDRIELTDRLRALCPKEPLGTRSDRADWYVWNGPATAVPKDDNGILTEFAVTVIRQQPGDYLRAVGRDTAPHFLPWRIGPASRCLRERWTLPASLRDPTTFQQHCHADPAPAGWSIAYADSSKAPAGNALTRSLHAYSGFVRLPSLALTAVCLLAITVLARRRRGPTAARDVLLLVLTAVALIVPTVVIGMYELRYALPALPFVCLAGAMAVDSLRQRALR